MSSDRGKPVDWAAKHAAIDAAAKAIIDQEKADREAKTARLKALRAARPAMEADPTGDTRKVGKTQRTKRARSQR